MTEVEINARVGSYGDDGEGDGVRDNRFGERGDDYMAPARAKSALDRDGPSEQPESDRCGTGLELTRRSSSIGISLMSDYLDTCGQPIPPPKSGKTFMMDAYGAPTSLQPSNSDLPYRPMVGAGAAAAFEALRDDFFIQKHKREQQQKRRMSSLSMGSAKGRNVWKPTHPEEQYEMLKLHHLNLMNEIQETELMLNLYEQQQLVQEQRAQMRQIQLMQLQTAAGRGEHGMPETEQRNGENINNQMMVGVHGLSVGAREVDRRA